MNGNYTREEGKKISKLVDEIKVKLMELGRTVDFEDVAELNDLFEISLKQYACEAKLEIGRKLLSRLSGDFKKSLMEIEKDEDEDTDEWEFLR